MSFPREANGNTIGHLMQLNYHRWMSKTLRRSLEPLSIELARST